MANKGKILLSFKLSRFKKSQLNVCWLQRRMETLSFLLHFSFSIELESTEDVCALVHDLLVLTPAFVFSLMDKSVKMQTKLQIGNRKVQQSGYISVTSCQKGHGRGSLFWVENDKCYMMKFMQATNVYSQYLVSTAVHQPQFHLKLLPFMSEHKSMATHPSFQFYARLLKLHHTARLNAII